MSGEIVVPGSGRTPNDVLLCGEAPGREEANRGRPFVGKSGREQDWYLSRHKLHSATFYKTNVVKSYTPGNPDPTAAQIERWTPVLEREIAEVKPSLVIAVGRFAARWFLGDRAEMDLVHGLPHAAGAFDPARRNRSQGAVVVPVYHPAVGLYDSGMKTVVAKDYAGAAAALEALRSDRTVDVLGGPEEGTPAPTYYTDVSGDYVAKWLDIQQPRILALDTEGTPTRPWSIQLSDHAGQAVVLRASQPDFHLGTTALQRAADRGTLFILHDASTPAGCCYDVQMCRAMGVELARARTWNTMYAAYLLREGQGLKTLAWRHLGMRMEDYQSLVKNAAEGDQVDYLVQVAEGKWPKPEPREVRENDGTVKVKKPQSLQSRANSILLDWGSGKKDKDGNGVDLESRWGAVQKDLRVEVAEIEEEIGRFPVSTIDDIPLDDAVRYAGMDADATLRLYHALRPKIEEADLGRTMEQGMEVLSAFERMQRTGIPADRLKFKALAEEVDKDMVEVQKEISSRFFSGRPINPGSPPQVNALMRRRGLTGKKKTKTGAMSTSKPSIEHLRYEDEAIDMVFDWREKGKIRDFFCLPAIERIPEGRDVDIIRCVIKTTRTTTRRAAMEEPNLQQVPVRSELGKRVRGCYVALPGERLGAADLSQIEMRAAAHESGDETLCQMFIDGRDIHYETAARIFGRKIYERADSKEERYQDIDKDTERDPTKSAGFGILYGIGDEGLLTQVQMMGLIDWTKDRCGELIAEWLKVYRGVAEEIKRTAKEARRVGWVRDYWGVYRDLPGIDHYERGVRAEAERFAFSHRIQGFAQGMIQNSMIWLEQQVREYEDVGVRIAPCLQIHDEVMLRYEEDLEEVVKDLTLEALTEHCGVELRVPVEAEWHSGLTWAELK